MITIGQSTAPGSGIIQIKANDQDSGQFGKIVYEITRNVDNLFTIDSETGVGKFQNYTVLLQFTPNNLRVCAWQNSSIEKCFKICHIFGVRKSRKFFFILR